MSVKLSSDRKKELRASSAAIFKWLCYLPEYRRAYRAWEKEVRKGRVLKYEIIRTAFKGGVPRRTVSILPEDIHPADPEKVSRSWIEKERKRFEKKITPQKFLRQEQWRRKIGFYPPFDPEIFPNASFEVFFKRKYAQGFYDSPVKVTNYSMTCVRNRQFTRTFFNDKTRAFPVESLPPLPAVLKVEINYRESKDLIEEEIGKIVRDIQEEYRIAQRRAQLDPILYFKASMLKALGLNRGQVRNRLMPKSNKMFSKTKLKSDNPQNESHRKKLDRVLDEIFRPA